LSGTIFFWFLSLAALINSQGVILVLGASATATAVATYSTLRTAAGLLGYISGVIQPSLWPELTFIHSQNQMMGLSQVSLFSIKLIVALTGLTATILFIFLPVIYPIWTGHQMNYDPILFTIFLIQGVLASGWITASWPLLASNQHKHLAFYSMLNAVITIILSLFFVNWWGMIGVALATLIGDLIFGLLIFPFLAAKGLGIRSIFVFLAIFRPLLVLFLFVTIIFSINLLLPDWQIIVDMVIITLLIVPVIYFSVGRRDVVRFYQKIIKYRPNSLINNES
jgi:O-antigen/teichoic acid export membrane protein